MKQLKIIIKARDIVENCISFIDVNYTDTILRGNQYFDIIQKNLIVKNNCSTPLTIPARILFSQVDNQSSTFNALIKRTTIAPGTTINLPVYYNGIYKGLLNTLTYNFKLINTNITYIINTVNNDTPGTITDLTFELNNRTTRVFVMSDFTTIYNDPDGNQIAFVIIEGGVSHIYYNNIPYVSGTEVPVADIVAGKLKTVAPDQNAGIVYISTLKIKDDNNNIII